jgi:hypothetical protein
MKASNLGEVVIFIGEESTLYIFPSMVHERGADTIEINLSLYKYKYFPFIWDLGIGIHADKINYYIDKSDYPYIYIYLGTMYVVKQRL